MFGLRQGFFLVKKKNGENYLVSSRIRAKATLSGSRTPPLAPLPQLLLSAVEKAEGKSGQSLVPL